MIITASTGIAAQHIGADAVVALGLAATTAHVRIERQARNHASADAGDAAGERRGEDPVA